MRRLAFAVALGLATAARAASAEPAGDARAAARELGEKGDAAFGAGRCDKAIEAWQKADALFHAPTLLLRVARCQALLGRVVAATATLERIVGEALPAEAPPTWADAKNQAQNELAAVKGRIARVDVKVNGPAGEAPRISVDDETLPVGEAVARVDPGAHRVVIHVADATAERRLSVGDGEEKTLSVTIAVEPGRPASHLQRNTGLVVGALGVIAIGVGAGFGISALGIASRLDGACGKNRRDCAPSEQPSIDRLGAHALVADFAAGGGAALALTGGILVLTDGSGKKSEPKVKLQLGRATVLEVGR